MYTVYYHPACNTCKKAIKWLEKTGIEVDLKHIVDETPSYEILKDVHEKSGLPISKLFNTSGKVYREMNIKEKKDGMTQDEILHLLASEGMLIKRPILIGKSSALIGFKEEEWGDKVK